MDVIVQERVFLQVGESIRFLSNVSKTAAEELVDKIQKSLSELSFFPRMHPLIRGSKIGELEFRQTILPGGRYALIYLIKDEKIYVEHFIDFRRNNKLLLSDLDAASNKKEQK